MSNFSFQNFQAQIQTIVQVIENAPLNNDLEKLLNKTFPPSSEVFLAIENECRMGIDQEQLCENSAGGVMFGRAIKANDTLNGFSVDVVKMADLKGPHHIHPKGEIDMIMPISKNAKFDGMGAGWMVYEPDSDHSPTVSDGEAIILYLLPDGKIKFTKN